MFTFIVMIWTREKSTCDALYPATNLLSERKAKLLHKTILYDKMIMPTFN